MCVCVCVFCMPHYVGISDGSEMRVMLLHILRNHSDGKRMGLKLSTGPWPVLDIISI